MLTLTPHIMRAPQIDEEDLVPIWVGTENNVSFSGLNVRLESPQAPATPFDPPSEPPASRPVAPTTAVPSTVPTPGAVPIQGSGPNDPFKPSSTVAADARPVAAEDSSLGRERGAGLVELRREPPGRDRWPSASRSRTPSCPQARPRR